MERKSTAVEEMKDVRHALLDLARSLLEVATGTIVTAADAAFTLVNDAVVRVRKQLQAPPAPRSAVARRSRA